MPTVYEICESVKQVDKKTGKTHKASPSVVEGLTVRNAPTKSGLVQLTPAQAASVIVERVELNGKIEGYQRGLGLPHARRVARSLERGKDVGEVTLALDNGRVFAVDGQHRLVGSVIARKPIWAVIRPMTERERAERFASQRLAVKLNGDTLILASNDKLSEYVKDAVVATEHKTPHPWSGIVAIKSDPTHISPTIMAETLARYCLNRIGNSSYLSKNLVSTEAIKAFKAANADEFADLIRAFGTKQANPFAFKPVALKAIADAAVLILVRGGKRPEDMRRWISHMPKFDWIGYAWMARPADLTIQLISHWNKRLSPENKVRYQP